MSLHNNNLVSINRYVQQQQSLQAQLAKDLIQKDRNIKLIAAVPENKMMRTTQRCGNNNMSDSSSCSSTSSSISNFDQNEFDQLFFDDDDDECIGGEIVDWSVSSASPLRKLETDEKEKRKQQLRKKMSKIMKNQHKKQQQQQGSNDNNKYSFPEIHSPILKSRTLQQKHRTDNVIGLIASRPPFSTQYTSQKGKPVTAGNVRNLRRSEFLNWCHEPKIFGNIAQNYDNDDNDADHAKLLGGDRLEEEQNQSDTRNFKRLATAYAQQNKNEKLGATTLIERQMLVKKQNINQQHRPNTAPESSMLNAETINFVSQKLKSVQREIDNAPSSLRTKQELLLQVQELAKNKHDGHEILLQQQHRSSPSNTNHNKPNQLHAFGNPFFEYEGEVMMNSTSPSKDKTSGKSQSGGGGPVVPHGRGILRMKDGTTLEGTFIKGEFTTIDNIRNNDAPPSPPTSIKRWPNGCVYSGGFLDGEPHGRGTLLNSATGDRYEGEFAVGHYHGKGNLVFRTTASAASAATTTGDCTSANQITLNRYTGEFRQNKFHGRGVLLQALNQSVLKAMFRDGMPSGRCHVEFLNLNDEMTILEFPKKNTTIAPLRQIDVVSPSSQSPQIIHVDEFYSATTGVTYSGPMSSFPPSSSVITNRNSIEISSLTSYFNYNADFAAIINATSNLRRCLVPDELEVVHVEVDGNENLYCIEEDAHANNAASMRRSVRMNKSSNNNNKNNDGNEVTNAAPPKRIPIASKSASASTAMLATLAKFMFLKHRSDLCWKKIDHHRKCIRGLNRGATNDENDDSSENCDSSLVAGKSNIRGKQAASPAASKRVVKGGALTTIAPASKSNTNNNTSNEITTSFSKNSSLQPDDYTSALLCKLLFSSPTGTSSPLLMNDNVLASNNNIGSAKISPLAINVTHLDLYRMSWSGGFDSANNAEGFLANNNTLGNSKMITTNNNIINNKNAQALIAMNADLLQIVNTNALFSNIFQQNQNIRNSNNNTNVVNNSFITVAATALQRSMPTQLEMNKKPSKLIEWLYKNVNDKICGSHKSQQEIIEETEQLSLPSTNKNNNNLKGKKEISTVAVNPSSTMTTTTSQSMMNAIWCQSQFPRLQIKLRMTCSQEQQVQTAKPASEDSPLLATNIARSPDRQNLPALVVSSPAGSGRGLSVTSNSFNSSNNNNNGNHSSPNRQQQSAEAQQQQLQIDHEQFTIQQEIAKNPYCFLNFKMDEIESRRRHVSESGRLFEMHVFRVNHSKIQSKMQSLMAEIAELQATVLASTNSNEIVASTSPASNSPQTPRGQKSSPASSSPSSPLQVFSSGDKVAALRNKCDVYRKLLQRVTHHDARHGLASEDSASWEEDLISEGLIQRVPYLRVTFKSVDDNDNENKKREVGIITPQDQQDIDKSLAEFVKMKQNEIAKKVQLEKEAAIQAQKASKELKKQQKVKNNAEETPRKNSPATTKDKNVGNNMDFIDGNMKSAKRVSFALFHGDDRGADREEDDDADENIQRIDGEYDDDDDDDSDDSDDFFSPHIGVEGEKSKKRQQRNPKYFPKWNRTRFPFISDDHNQINDSKYDEKEDYGKYASASNGVLNFHFVPLFFNTDIVDASNNNNTNNNSGGIKNTRNSSQRMEGDTMPPLHPEQFIVQIKLVSSSKMREKNDIIQMVPGNPASVEKLPLSFTQKRILVNLVI